MRREDLEEIWGKYDCREAFCYLTGEQETPGSLSWENVREVVAHSIGEHDERDWMAAGWLDTGEAFVLSAGCDYTGWDCRAGGWSNIGPSLEAVLWPAYIPDDVRERLGEQLRAAGVNLLDAVPAGAEWPSGVRGHNTAWDPANQPPADA